MLTDGPQRLDASGNSALEVEHNCFFPSHPAPLWGAQTGTCGLGKTGAGGDAGTGVGKSGLGCRDRQQHV